MADTRAVGTELRRNAFGKCTAYRTEPFKDTLAGPVDIGLVFKNYINKAHPKHGRTADIFYLRYSLQAGNQRVSNLVFNKLGRAPAPFGKYNDLVFGEVGNGINRVFLYGNNPPDKNPGCQHQYDKAVAERPFDNSMYHFL